MVEKTKIKKVDRDNILYLIRTVTTEEEKTCAGLIATKLSIELSELKKLRSDAESIKDAIIIKERLLNELRDYLDRKNKEVK